MIMVGLPAGQGRRTGMKFQARISNSPITFMRIVEPGAAYPN